MTDNLWGAIAPLEEEAEKILAEAREEASAILARARQEAGEISEKRAEERIVKQAETQEKISKELDERAAASRREALESASQIILEARLRMSAAVDAVAERILDTRGNR